MFVCFYATENGFAGWSADRVDCTFIPVFFRILAQSTNPGRWDSSILRNPCAHFWLCCEILLRTSHCADSCEDSVFIKNSSYLFKHIFWRIFCWLTLVLMQVVSALVFIAGSGHRAFCLVLHGHFRMSHFQGRIAVIGMQLNSTWIQLELTKKWSDNLWSVLVETFFDIAHLVLLYLNSYAILLLCVK